MQQEVQEKIDQYADLLMRALSASLYEESGWTEVPQSSLSDTVNPLRWIGRLVQNALIDVLRRRSIVMVKTRKLDPRLREAGRDWPFFGYTMVGHHKLRNVKFCVEDVIKRQVPGDFIETGVWRGGTTIFMRALLNLHGVKDRKVWVADSFEGLPKPKNHEDGRDYSHVEYLKVPLETVQANFARFGLLDDQVGFIKGWFGESLPRAPIKKLAVLRLDGDLYSSTMDSLTNLYDKVSPGGYAIVDDYHSWPECKRAVTDFLEERGENPEIIRINDSLGVYWQVAAD